MPTNEPERWLEEHGSALYSFALLHLRDPQRAEDAVQETLLAALQARVRYAGNSSVRTWLTGILKHKIIDEFRRQSRETPASDPRPEGETGTEDCALDENFTAGGRWNRPLADWGDPEYAFSQEQFWALVERCITALSPRMARLFILRELWEMETDEVCKELDITPTNLWTTLHRARLSMRRCLEGFVQP